MDLFRPHGVLSWRKLRVLVQHLPAESATAQAVSGHTAWTQGDELLATLVDVANLHRWQHQAANFKGRPKQPEPVTRPQRRTQRRHMNHTEMAAMFGLALRAGYRGP